jgi:Mor family transcriptional regulator
MSYRSAEQILPAEIIALIQQYVDGENIYIPRKSENRKKWGERSRIKEELQQRNREIYLEYLQGMRMDELAQKYYLSEKSIQRIVYRARKSA